MDDLSLCNNLVFEQKKLLNTRILLYFRHFIIRSFIESTTIFMLIVSSLLEKERHICFPTLRLNAENLIRIHWSGSLAGFTTNNNPIDFFKFIVESGQSILEKHAGDYPASHQKILLINVGSTSS